MKTPIALALALALAAFGGSSIFNAHAAPLAAHSPMLSWSAANRIVGVWDFQVQTFNCTTGVGGPAFRARSVFNVGGTLEDTNNRLQSTRGPAFGVWTYDPRAREYVTRSRLFRYAPDGSSPGVNLVERTLKLSRDGNSATSRIKVSILGLNEELLATDCATQDGVRSL